MPYPFSLSRLVSALAVAAGLVCASGAAAEGLSIRAQALQQLRIESIGYRLAVANARYCTQPQMATGMLLHELSQYPQRDRSAISAAFSLYGGFGVLGTVPSSPAMLAGLKTDDEILAVNGRSVDDFRRAYAQRQSFSRMEKFQAQLQNALKRGPAELLVRRAGSLFRMALRGAPGCGGEPILRQSGSINAWSDGKYVVLTSGLASLATSDDEISFVMAHEMAHNLLGHNVRRSPSALMEMLGIGTVGVRRDEKSADAFAVTLMDSARYQPASAVTFLERARRKLWWQDFSISHPSFGARINSVAAAIGRLPHPQLQPGARLQTAIAAYGQVQSGRNTAVAPGALLVVETAAAAAR
jgi:hypothetical protein